LNPSAQTSNIPPGDIQPPLAEPIAFGEPLPFVGTGVFEEEAPLWGTGFEEQADFGESAFGENTRGATATAGNAVAIAGGGAAMAESGTVAAVVG
jgi:hypothetical protein